MSSSPPPEVVTFRDVSPADDPTPEDLPDGSDARTPEVLAEPAHPRRGLRERLTAMHGGVRPWSAWTLRAKLVASMLALFTVVSMMTAVFTITALNSHLTAQVDGQLEAALRPDRTGGPGSDDGDGPRGPGADRIVVQITSARTVGILESSDQPVPLTSAQIATIQSAGVRSNEGTTIDLGGSLGRYRMMSKSVTFLDRTGTQTPGTLVVGLSSGPTDATIGRLVIIAISGVGLGLVLVSVLGTWIVRRNLEPLQRVADTATRVSRMPLSSGKVALAERVDPADTDTRTEVGQVGAALNEMLDHVDEALNSRHQSEQRVRQFVADASHELRTPLASIKGYAELSRREPEEVPTSVTHAMGRIESEANRMSSLVEDLLLLARLDAGRPLEQKPVDLSMIVINAVSDAHAASPDHVWDLDLPPEPIEVTGDTARLHQVAANLLANARTHTPAGTRVTTAIRQEADWVRLTVHDNGPGVPEALQPNVFERFARGDDARNRVGGSTGLGLSIVAAVAKALGGRVELQSRPGDTTFTVLLPAHLVPDSR
ncbi:two-component system OmpR family sensor kinase [Humibacillus xanthopallidus]|uniref:histidine kinase n=1 Tax=Humibacillus xanthopallidus TaxID=412689 RepID=A0A543PPM8_9MICO|nr:HAMP domain-containing sensor histidine kinase [Humibacillus xanthopallidus]TQN46034.1 two-component system OmpR family sensor kinase [Humibacillus xanthopallidus]